MTHDSLHRLGRLGAAITFAISTAGTTLASTARIDHTAKTELGRTLTSREQAIVSTAATKVLRHVATARGRIHEKKVDAAKNALAAGSQLGVRLVELRAAESGVEFLAVETAAQADLAQATTQADDALESQIGTISPTLGAMKSAPKRTDLATRGRYAKVRSDLRRLIRDT